MTDDGRRQRDEAAERLAAAMQRQFYRNGSHVAVIEMGDAQTILQALRRLTRIEDALAARVGAEQRLLDVLDNEGGAHA